MRVHPNTCVPTAASLMMLSIAGHTVHCIVQRFDHQGLRQVRNLSHIRKPLPHYNVLPVVPLDQRRGVSCVQDSTT